MDLSVLAELISAFAALGAIAITVVELIFRNAIKKTVPFVELYADYLYIVQQIECSVENFRSLIKNLSTLNPVERNAYATVHSITDKFFDSVHEFEKNGICNSNYNHSNNDNSKLFVDFLSSSSEMVKIINSCYHVVTKSDATGESDSMEHYINLIDQYYLSWSEYKTSVGNLLLGKLSSATKPKLKYLICSIIALVLVVALIWIYMASNK